MAILEIVGIREEVATGNGELGIELTRLMSSLIGVAIAREPRECRGLRGFSAGALGGLSSAGFEPEPPARPGNEGSTFS